MKINKKQFVMNLVAKKVIMGKFNKTGKEEIVFRKSLTTMREKKVEFKVPSFGWKRNLWLRLSKSLQLS